MEKVVKVERRYFDDDAATHPYYGVYFDVEAGIALRLIEHFAVVAAKIDGEDTAGRSKMELQSATELVDRAFDISAAFVARANKEGRVREAAGVEERIVKAGQLERLKHEQSYLGGDEPVSSLQEMRERIARRKQERETVKK